MSADALAAAKGALEHASKAFPSPAPMTAAKSHEYSHAPYSIVGEMKKKLSAPVEEYHKAVKDVEAPGTKQGIDYNNEQKKAAQ